jgi:hypothetical protein
MTGVEADVNGDGDLDLITKQKLGDATDCNQIEITRCSEMGTVWFREDPNPVDTSGFSNNAWNEILRPRNLAAADLFGNTLPEIIAGFGPAFCDDDDDDEKRPRCGVLCLRFAVWANSCIGDVSCDGKTDEGDLALLLAAYESCDGDADFYEDADLNKDGCIDISDIAICVTDFGCTAIVD